MSEGKCIILHLTCVSLVMSVAPGSKPAAKPAYYIICICQLVFHFEDFSLFPSSDLYCNIPHSFPIKYNVNLSLSATSFVWFSLKKKNPLILVYIDFFFFKPVTFG